MAAPKWAYLAFILLLSFQQFTARRTPPKAPLADNPALADNPTHYILERPPPPSSADLAHTVPPLGDDDPPTPPPSPSVDHTHNVSDGIVPLGDGGGGLPSIGVGSGRGEGWGSGGGEGWGRGGGTGCNGGGEGWGIGSGSGGSGSSGGWGKGGGTGGNGAGEGYGRGSGLGDSGSGGGWGKGGGTGGSGSGSGEGWGSGHGNGGGTGSGGGWGGGGGSGGNIPSYGTPPFIPGMPPPFGDPFHCTPMSCLAGNTKACEQGFSLHFYPPMLAGKNHGNNGKDGMAPESG
ncbi:hypothetical protein LOK49_LG09G00674 [Camellia lanceoleosa]|uniref:Uncharacterized protein n=1 Tax=Camellia lanceoleosa TaxID=1840588 RepID=A0ACC0GMT3_9ERIC|nr:hypothetical protein LOK49_LG09G00674 [Camellia lanceoleosa]